MSSRRSTKWRLSSAADADAMGAVAVAHKGIVESAINWSSETVWLLEWCDYRAEKEV